MTHEQFNERMCRFLADSPTAFHAVATMSASLESAGFVKLAEDSAWQLQAGGRYYLTRNDSSIIAFAYGRDSAPVEGMRLVGAHTDSPCLMVKPSPEIVCNGYFQLGVQVYGGALLNPWFDRDLSLAGKVIYLDRAGDMRSALVNFRSVIASIPSLAIHLDREANESRSVNPQTHIVPVLSQVPDGEQPSLRSLLLQHINGEHPELDAAEVLDFELSFYDTQAPAMVGLKNEFIAAARLDNLLSCFAGLDALLSADGAHSALLVCNDHEEVGSQSAIGAQGPFLASVLRRLAGSEEAMGALVEHSLFISTDNAHGIHPNHPDRHDENHGPLLNAGPVIKVNASQRYATNSETSAFFRLLCAREDVPLQNFVVRSDMACGSTIGPITAGVTGVRTLDVGVPTFGMHSIRELAGAQDGCNLSRVLRRFFDYPGPLPLA